VVGCLPRAFTVRLHRARRRLADALRRCDDQSHAHPRAARAVAGLGRSGFRTFDYFRRIGNECDGRPDDDGQRRPAGLERLAEDTYARRHGGDLARVLGEPVAGTRDDRQLTPAGAPRARVLTTRLLTTRALVTAGAGLAVAAVAAAVLITAPTAHGHPAAGGAGGTDSSQAILLTAAHVAAARSAATGT
jgi:hypothetical protein